MSEVTIYTLRGCRHSTAAKLRLRRKGIVFSEVRAAGRRSARTLALRDEFERRFGARTFPRILIGDRHVGGAADLARIDRAGELDLLLETQGRDGGPVTGWPFLPRGRLLGRPCRRTPSES
jgi:glutaredoxin